MHTQVDHVHEKHVHIVKKGYKFYSMTSSKIYPFVLTCTRFNSCSDQNDPGV